MPWKKLLANVTGSIDEELRLRNEYLVTENRILRSKIKGRFQLKDEERRELAAIGKQLGRKALEAVATIVKPDTILRWHAKLVARKFDGTGYRQSPGRPPLSPEVEAQILRFARQNRNWGYDRISGALKNLGHRVSDATVANVLRRHGLPPAHERKKETTWREFIRNHMDVLAATDFFTTEVWTRFGLVITYYILFFIHLGTRRIHIAGITPNPHQGIGNKLIFPQPAPEKSSEQAIECRERLGWLLKF
jgi:transposase